MVQQRRNGSVLILALWVLLLLTVFVTSIGLNVRQRMILLSRLEDRSQLHWIATSGIKKAIAALRYDSARNSVNLTAESKAYRYNNQENFERIAIGQGVATVSYPLFEDNIQKPSIIFGFIDEESKININTADRTTLKRLFGHVTTLQEKEAEDIVESIYNWREFGNTQLEGFFSDDYYANLPDPYSIKNAPFEVFEELLLIRGMDKELYEKIYPFITIYGDGLVNINTAAKPVLIALGLEEAIADKLLMARRGLDGAEATDDDHIFINPYDVSREVGSLVKLERKELIQIDFLNGAGKIKTNSVYYRITSFGQLNGKKEVLKIVSVYNARDHFVEYWNENN